MLHITNGDSVIEGWKQAGLAGEMLAWKDPLHEGPVPEGLALAELSNVRAHFLSDAGHGDYGSILQQFRRRDEQLKRSPEHEEVALWFEHDLYDQLQLIQILDYFSRKTPGSTRLTLINVDCYLGPLEPRELAVLLDQRRPVNAKDLSVAKMAWETFTSPDPRAIEALVNVDTSTLPYLRAAMKRLLEEYPALDSGLTRTQRQILEEAAAGASSRGEVFGRSQKREEAMFMGDTTFFSYLDDMRDASEPLIEEKGGELRVTAFGQQVLDGRADWLERHRIDRWIGGCHLESGRLLWRWERRYKRLAL